MPVAQHPLLNYRPSTDANAIECPPLVLDGALATELERHDPAPLNTPLWSAQTLLTSPASVRRVHTDYFLAGADVAITASYQAATRGLMQHAQMTEAEAEKVIAQSVNVAVGARNEALAKLGEAGADRTLLIAGSVGPYGAFLSDGSEYTGAYGPKPGLDASVAGFRTDMKNFHRARIAALLDAGADILAIETLPCLAEIEALVEMLAAEFPSSRAWVSCTVREDSNGVVVLSDGASLQAVCEVLNSAEQIVAMGVNCCSKGIVAPALEEMRKWTTKPLVAYPNSGEEWDAEKKVWKGLKAGEEKSWEVFVAEWRALGAVLIGGCCRTTPDDIRKIRECIS